MPSNLVRVGTEFPVDPSWLQSSVVYLTRIRPLITKPHSSGLCQRIPRTAQELSRMLTRLSAWAICKSRPVVCRAHPPG